MTQVPNYYTRREATDLLGVSAARVGKIAERDDWAAVRVGSSFLHPKEDVERSALKREAQKAWRALGIPHNLWGSWWLADTDEFEMFPCPDCGAGAYRPGGDHPRYSHRAACSACGWKE